MEILVTGAIGAVLVLPLVVLFWVIHRARTGEPLPGLFEDKRGTAPMALQAVFLWFAIAIGCALIGNCAG